MPNIQQFIRTCSILALAAGFAFSAVPAGALPQSGASSSELTIVVDGAPGPPVAFGLSRLDRALKEKGISLAQKESLAQAVTPRVLLVGTASASPDISALAGQGKVVVPGGKEGLVVKHLTEAGRNVLVIAGSDERGLMYALLEIARQIEGLPKGAPLFDAVKDVSEKPAVPVRSMAVFLHSADDEKGWYYSEDYWRGYFAMLAENRWNTFNLVFSHQTPYLAPMYPFHVAVDEYPDVKAIGLTEAQREKNLAMLRFISSLARDHGLEFTLSVWQQIAWEKDSPDRGQDSMVSGYNRKNMTDYTYRALTKLLRECPGITGLQLRLNYESGINFDEQTAFFKNGVFRAARESGRPILIEIRDIGLLRETLEAAVETKLPVRVSHKYWAEHMVFPYHPARFIWTYSYGDWLKYPRLADQIYQVWNLGSHRLLLWGDPEFVRRFAPTTTLGESVGFEMCAPLSQKGFGNAPGAWRIFRSPEREYYDWEYQRYWSTYLLFGRLTYNPGAGEEIWTRELDRRFGPQAAPSIARAYRSGSQVVSLIAAMAINNHNMGAWPEKDMGGLINYYLHLMPYDKARIRQFLEYVDDELAGRTSGRMSPEAVAARLEAVAAETEGALDMARRSIGTSHKEFWATEMDFRILSGMAKYFAQKIRATTRLGFFYRTGDASQLQQAIASGENALDSWKRVAALAEQIYSPNQVFGPGSVGHWKDNLRYVEDDLKQLKYQEGLFRMTQNADYAFDFGPEPLTATTEAWSTVYTNSFMVEPRFRGVFPKSIYDPALGFGWIQVGDLASEAVRPLPGSVWQGASRGDTPLPGNALLRDSVRGSKPAIFRVDLPEGQYQGMVILTDQSAKPADHGPLSVSVMERFGDRPIVDKETIRAGQTLIKTFNFNMTGERFVSVRIKFSAEPGADYIVNSLLFTRIEPHIAHVPIRTVEPGRDLNVKATVTLPSPPNDARPLTSLGIITSNASTLEMPTGIVRVTLKYGQGREDSFRALDMKASKDSIYGVVLPGGELNLGKLHYYLEAVDSTGRLVRLPTENSPQPCFAIDITADRAAPVLTHKAALEIEPGRPVKITAQVKDDSVIAKVVLYYRSMRQTMEYSALTMDRKGSVFEATIPGPAVSPEYDFMYYFEALDEHGNAVIFPNPEETQPYFTVKVKRETLKGAKS